MAIRTLRPNGDGGDERKIIIGHLIQTRCSKPLRHFHLQEKQSRQNIAGAGGATPPAVHPAPHHAA
jgi:hypothetical protein